MRIPIVNLKPAIEETRAAWEANLAALYERGVFILGPELERFERDLAKSLGAVDAVGVSSGSSAIELCLRDAGVTSAKQQVIVPALTAPFSAVAVLAAGATPRFADIDLETLQVDPKDIADRIGSKTAALLPVHLYGQPCAIGKIAKLAKQAKLKLVQDACQAHGAMPFTEYGNYVALSFYPTKNLGCLGDGGAILTAKESVAQRLRQARDGGRGPNQVAVVPGINARLDEMQCCYLNAFLPQLEVWNEKRRRLAAIYDEMLRGLAGVQLLRRAANSVCHLYVIRAERRDRLREHLTQAGIGAGIHYPVPLHLHPAFSGAKQKKGDLPHAERAAREILSLPLWPQLPEDQVRETAEAVIGFYKQ
ncbi:DegT/DnrJ/EryC1/StrS family aminotransferase [Bryobacter aggregatus]|uniref:DegT/DnrJ/EryC1/StrS family aminotransferase n=1 Tax=Bryobacter aggregatus TaxID=360054 RepID=UPI0004E17200|nr:DegT/DnrJ/EryC1/StrS family aminotransferase [Bryobacter aggregatus]